MERLSKYVTFTDISYLKVLINNNLDFKIDKILATRSTYQLWYTSAIKRNNKPLTVAQVARVISKHYKICICDFKDAVNRDMKYVLPRHITMYLAKRCIPKIPDKLIADYFDQQRSNVTLARKTIQNRVDTEKDFKELMDRFIKVLIR